MRFRGTYSTLLSPSQLPASRPWEFCKLPGCPESPATIFSYHRLIVPTTPCRFSPVITTPSPICLPDASAHEPRSRGKLTAAVPEARTASSSNFLRPPLCPTNEIDVLVEGVAVRALVDTGAVVSVISEKLCRDLRKVTTPLTNLALRTATSHFIAPTAQCTARVLIQDVWYAVNFVVLPRSSYDVIL